MISIGLNMTTDLICGLVLLSCDGRRMGHNGSGCHNNRTHYYETKDPESNRFHIALHLNQKKGRHMVPAILKEL